MNGLNLQGGITSKHNTMSITFLSIPVYIEDAEQSFFLFDLLMPSTCNDLLLMNIISTLKRFSEKVSAEKNIDRCFLQFLEELPFSCFNFIHLPDQTDASQSRMSQGITTLRVGHDRFIISTTVQLSVSLTISLMKHYIRGNE